MNQFTYKLKIEEMRNLNTKKSKIDFVKSNIRLSKEEINYYSIKLLIDIYKTIPKTITKVKSIPNLISKYIGTICNYAVQYNDTYDERLFELYDELISLDRTNSIPYNSFSAFTSSSGIPIYFKLAVLKALKDR